MGGTESKRGKAEKPALVRPSRALLACFAVYLRWYIGRHFRAVRLANGHHFPSAAGSLIVYSNHASWWDPLLFVILSRHFLPVANHYAPMDAAALRYYKLLSKLGMFPVEAGTTKGAAQFMRAVHEIFAVSGSVLWLTPEGRFTDVRTRPAVFRPGMAATVARLGTCTIVPLAVEYTFWDERLPEMLISCGEPIHVADGHAHPAAEWNEMLSAALAQTQDELAALAKLRDPARFSTVQSGRVGISGVYESWLRLRALVSGRVYLGSHARAAAKGFDE